MNKDQAWAWCEQAFQQPGRAADLLRAQDEEGLDLVLQLFVEYVGERQGIALDLVARQEAEALVRPWREQVVAPLRALRRAMKEKPAPGAGWIEGGAAVRDLVQQAELRAERAELDALCDWLARRRSAIRA